MWLAFATFLSARGVLLLVRLVLKSRVLPGVWSFSSLLDRADLTCVSSLIIGPSSFHTRMCTLLARALASTASELTPAVCLSMLFGGESEEAILASAQRLFRTVPVSAIRVQDLCSASAIVSSAVKSTPLGFCDAFVSHSYVSCARVARALFRRISAARTTLAWPSAPPCPRPQPSADRPTARDPVRRVRPSAGGGTTT
jgi:hypothetical protein